VWKSIPEPSPRPRLNQVGHELGADRHPRLVLTVLPRVPEVRHHHRHPRRRCPLGRIDQQQQLDDIVTRRRRRLHDEDVAAPGVLIDPGEDLTIREPLDRHIAQRQTHVPRNLLRQRTIRCAAQQQQRS
jgi:hypothetical protein